MGPRSHRGRQTSKGPAGFDRIGRDQGFVSARVIGQHHLTVPFLHVKIHLHARQPVLDDPFRHNAEEIKHSPDRAVPDFKIG